jgi:hypothetical protein
MHLSGLDLFFWVAGLFGHIVLLLVLCLKRRARRFPMFTTIISLYVARTVALFFILRDGSQSTYFYTYWSLAVVDVVLQLLVLLEVAFHVFRPLGTWAADIRRSFLWLLGVSMILASALTWLAAPATKLAVQTIVIRGNFFFSVLMSELFVAMVGLSVTAGLSWKIHVARIAQGWGVYSIVCILVQGLQSYFGVVRGTETYLVLSRVRISTYLVCLVYWIMTLWMDAPELRELPEQIHRQLLDLNRRAALTLSYLRFKRHAE